MSDKSGTPFVISESEVVNLPDFKLTVQEAIFLQTFMRNTFNSTGFQELVPLSLLPMYSSLIEKTSTYLVECQKAATERRNKTSANCDQQ